MNIADALIRDHGGKQRGDEVSYRCLHHPNDDKSASYNSVKDTFFCHSCGEKGPGWKLAEKLGLPTNGHHKNGGSPTGRIVGTYDYRDAAGKLLFQTVRKADPKDFFQQSPNGKGGWIPGLNGAQRVLYRLPELQAADPSAIVFIVEGEKDVDRLRLMDRVATTNPMGAGKWRPEYAEELTGRRVVILPDNDEAGRNHAQMVARSLYGKAASVKIVQLPGLLPKGDVSDWLDLHHTIDELDRLVDAAPEWAPTEVKTPGWKGHVFTHDQLMKATFAPHKWIVEGLVADEGLTFLGSKKKRGKSWLCLQMAQAVAMGTPLLDRETAQGNVVYLCLEDGPRRLQERLTLQHAPEDLPITYVTRFEPLDGDGMADLEKLIAELKPRLVIIDTLAAAKSGKTDENAAGPMADLANALRQMAQDHHVGILVVAHHGKQTGGDAGDDIRGSSAVAGAADVILGLYRTDAGAHTLKAMGRDIEDAELRIEFDANDTFCWHLLGDARALARQEAEEEIISALEALGEADATAIAKEANKSRAAVQVGLKRLRTAGTVEHRTEKIGKISRILYRLPKKEGNPLLTLHPLQTKQPLHPLQGQGHEENDHAVNAVRGVRHKSGVADLPNRDCYSCGARAWYVDAEGKAKCGNCQPDEEVTA